MTENLPRTGDVLSSPPPAVSEDQASALARDLFDVTGIVSRLTSERDANFRISAPGGSGYVLKIANPAEPREVTNLQTMALLHIAHRDHTLPVPRVVRSVDGATEVVVAVDGGIRCVARILTFLDGEPLHRVRTGASQRDGIARCLASLSVSLADFDHPGARHDLLWDITRASRLRPLIPFIADETLRDIAQQVLDVFDGEIAPIVPSLRHQVVHNDFNPSNILMDPTDHDRVCGILDFGDIVRTALVNDVAIAASYHIVSDSDPMEPIRGFAAAYHRVLPLQREELDILFDLIMVRLVTTVAITNWRAARHPDNAAYILRNNPNARAGLQRLAALDRKAVRRELLRVCDLE